MTNWEAELKRLASGEADVALPNAREISAALGEIADALRGVVSDGLQGDAGEAAIEAFHRDAADAMQLAYDIELVGQKVRAANLARRDAAEKELAELEKFPESLSWWQEAALRTAAVGSTWVLGPFSFVVADGVVGNVNDFLASHRQARAQEGVRAVSAVMDARANDFGTEPRIERSRGQSLGTMTEPTSPSNPGGTTGGTNPGGGGGGSSFDRYPDSHVSPLDDVPPGFTYDPPRDDGEDPTTPIYPTYPPQPEPPTCPPGPDDHDVTPPYPPGPGGNTVFPPLPDGYQPPGGTGYPDGYDPNDPSTWGLGGRGGLTSDSSMGGGSHAWGTGGTRTGAGFGGFGAGGIGGAGGGMGLGGGAGSAALLGGAGGAVSLAGAKLMQTGGPGMGSGLLGGAGSGTTAGGAAGAGASGARGGSVGMMGGGAAGGGAAEKKSRPGLSGLRAPQLDGDEDPTPRSEAAGAGGRDL